MISKELLSIIKSEELSIVNADFISCKLKNKEIVIKCKYLHTKLTPTFYYNIYELAHKCKEWASINSYALESSVHMQPKRSSVAGCQIHWRYETEDLPYFEAGSEPEAIFAACQWILTKDSK